MRWDSGQRVWSVVGSALLVPALGCGFVTKAPTTGDCGKFLHSSTCTSGGTTTTTNMAFVANAGSNTVSGFSISTAGALAGLTGTPISLSVPPLALAVSRNNEFLWVGTASQIFGYSISSAGALTPLNSGAALTNAFCVDMQTTPDGKFLMVLDGSGNSIDLFAIGTDGSLTVTGGGGVGFTPTSGTSVPRALRINPAGTVVAAALGTAGEILFSFDASTGTLAQLGKQTVPPNLTSDYGIAWDPTGNYLFVVRTGTSAGLVVEQVASTGVLTPTTSTVYGTGSNPYAVTLDTTGKYVYVANHGDSTISAWSVGANEALTSIVGSPFTSGLGVSTLGADSSANFLLATAQSGSPDLSVYNFDVTTAGKLDVLTSSATGTTANFLALSH